MSAMNSEIVFSAISAINSSINALPACFEGNQVWGYKEQRFKDEVGNRFVMVAGPAAINNVEMMMEMFRAMLTRSEHFYRKPPNRSYSYKSFEDKLNCLWDIFAADEFLYLVEFGERCSEVLIQFDLIHANLPDTDEPIPELATLCKEVFAVFYPFAASLDAINPLREVAVQSHITFLFEPPIVHSITDIGCRRSSLLADLLGLDDGEDYNGACAIAIYLACGLWNKVLERMPDMNLTESINVFNFGSDVRMYALPEFLASVRATMYPKRDDKVKPKVCLWFGPNLPAQLPHFDLNISDTIVRQMDDKTVRAYEWMTGYWVQLESLVRELLSTVATFANDCGLIDSTSGRILIDGVTLPTDEMLAALRIPDDEDLEPEQSGYVRFAVPQMNRLLLARPKPIICHEELTCAISGDLIGTIAYHMNCGNKHVPVGKAIKVWADTCERIKKTPTCPFCRVSCSGGVEVAGIVIQRDNTVSTTSWTHVGNLAWQPIHHSDLLL